MPSKSLTSDSEQANSMYAYSSEDIIHILKSRIKDLSPTYERSLRILEGASKMKPRSLIDVIQADKQTGARISLIPYMVCEGVWAGILLEYNQRGQLHRALYLDSTTLDEDDVARFVTKVLSSIYPDFKLQALECLKQTFDKFDQKSSGVFTIENLLLFAINSNPDLELISSDSRIIRRSHMQSLQLHEPRYYYGFIWRQKFNVTKQDDKVMTALMLTRLTDLLAADNPTFFDNASIREQFRQNYFTTKNPNATIRMNARNPIAVASIDNSLKVRETDYALTIPKEIDAALNSIDNFRNLDPLPLAVIGGGIVGTTFVYECGVTMLTEVGSLQRTALVEAFSAGSASGVFTQARSMLSSTLVRTVTSYNVVPAMLFSIAALTINKNGQDLTEAMDTALILYKQGMRTEDGNKFKEAEEILRKVAGLQDDPHVEHISTLMFIQTSSNQYAKFCLLLGMIIYKNNKSQSCEFIEEALKYAIDERLQYTCWLWFAKAASLISLQQQADTQNGEENSHNIMCRKMAKELQVKFPNVKDQAVNYAIQSTKFVLSHLMQPRSINNDEMQGFLAGDFISIISSVEPTGPVCSAIVLFMQAICAADSAASSLDKRALFCKHVANMQPKINSKADKLEQINIIMRELIEFAKRNNWHPDAFTLTKEFKVNSVPKPQM